MAKGFTYKNIQEMRNAIKEEIVSSGINVWNVEWEKLVEMRVQTAISAGMFEDDVLKEVKVRDKDK